MPRKVAKSEALSVEETKPSAAPAAKKPRAKKVAAKPALTAAPVSAEPSLDQIAEEAYLLWQSEGQPHGRDVEHWLIAEQIVRSRLSLLAAAVHTA